MSDARILDRGYRKYDGERSGVAGGVRSVVRHTVRSILGLGRPGRHKIFPVIVAVVAFVPALVFVAISILLGEIGDDVRPEYWEFFGFSIMAAILFTAFVAPEAIVRDRRDGMFSLYLSTPLTKPTYLLAKAAAVVGTLWLIIGGPAVLAFVGYTVQGQGPDGFPGWIGVAARLLLGGLVASVIYAAVSLAASSLTDRRAFASIAVVLLVLGVSIAVSATVESDVAPDEVRLLDPVATPLEIPARLFGGETFEYAGISTALVVLACAAWLLIPVGIIAARYRKLAAV